MYSPKKFYPNSHKLLEVEDCVKSVRIRSFSGTYFPTLALNTPYLSVFGSNAGNYEPEKLQIQTLVTQWKAAANIGSVFISLWKLPKRNDCYCEIVAPHLDTSVTDLI